MPLSSLPFLAFLSGGVALDKAPALCDEASEKWTSYGDLRAQLQALAPLWRTGTEAEDRGLILCAAPRTVSGAIALLSACSSGHVVFPMDPGIVRLAPFIAAYDPEWVIAPSKPSESYAAVDWPFQDLGLWRRAAPGKSDIHPDLFLLLLPPGPEGQTRTVRLSYKNIASNVEASCEALGVTALDRALLHLPLSFTLGLSVLMNLLTAGGSLLLTETNIKSREFWGLAREREATLFPGIPFHYDYVARAGLEHLRVPRLKTFWQAGSAMPLERLQELAKQIEARKGRFFILFGQAEAGPRMAVLAAHDFPEKLGSAGRALRGGTLTIENGEVLYEGPNVMMGYADGRADLSRGNETGERLRTGERGFLDKEGFLYLTR